MEDKTLPLVKPQGIGAYLFEHVIKNWKTTLTGAVGLFAAFIVGAPHVFGGEQAALVQFARLVNAGALAGLGIHAFDSRRAAVKAYKD